MSSRRPSNPAWADAAGQATRETATWAAQIKTKTALSLWGLALLAGCASKPQPAPELPSAQPALPQPEPRIAEPVPPNPQLRMFEERQREAARTFMRQQRWVDAQWAWQVILALHPQDGEALAQRAAASVAAAKAVAEKLPLAQLAQQKGEWDSATRWYLEVLSLDPGHAEAADALRQVERQRTKRGVVTGAWGLYTTPAGSGSRRTGSSRHTTDGVASVAGSSDVTTALTVANQDMEHASLLAGQGELDAAIALLTPLLNKPGPAAGAVRKQLLALYLDKAALLEKTDTASAVTSLELALQLAPNDKDARARLQSLKAQVADPGAKPQTANR